MSTESVRIDAHHHLWDLDVRPQEWTQELPALNRSFVVDDLTPLLAAHEVRGSILVETVNIAPETGEFLALAAQHPSILGVVGWVDLTAPDVTDRLAELRELPGGDHLVAIRHQVQLEADPNWLVRDVVLRGLRAVADAGLAFDLLVLPHQLPAAIEATRRVEQMSWVLDHAAKPRIADGQDEPWRSLIADLAAQPSVSCKLSGLVTEASLPWSVREIRPYAQDVLDAFGPERVMFGSDWPVCLLRASYDEVVAMTADLIAPLSPAEQAWVWGGAAVRAYGLGGY